MQATKKQILEAFQKISEKREDEVNTFEELMELLKAEGVDATAEEVNETLTEFVESTDKEEMSKEVLDTIAGGWGFIGLIVKGAASLAKKMIGGGKTSGGSTGGWGGGGASGGWDDGGASGGWEGGETGDPTGGNPGGNGGNTQNNSNNSGIQQNNQVGDNTNTGGMSQNF